MGYLTMSLRESAEFDKKNGAKGKLTGWGIISKERAAAKISRKEKRKLKPKA